MTVYLRDHAKGFRDKIADPGAAIDTVLKRNELARKEVELERLAMAIEQNIVTPWVREHGFGGIDRGRIERALDQIGLAFPYKNKPKPEDVFDDQFLPPAAERKVD